MSGILEKIIATFERKIIENKGESITERKGVVKIEYIVDFIRALQTHEYDAHVCIMGQNGNGKSYFMLVLMKLLDPNSILNNRIVYAYDKTSILITLLRESKSSVIGIDEAKKFFHYKQSMGTESIVLQNMIEYARENKNAIIACTNDIRRLNNNYRNAKVQLLVWLIDRFEEETAEVRSYGLVFVGNPALEEEDKFRMNFFQNLTSFEQIRLVAESLPTFYGYIFLEDIKNIVSDEELRYYKEQKKKGIETVAQEYIKRLERKENPEIQEKNTQIDKLKSMLLKRKAF